jgi:deoxyinosine 3'endonuclease (endonuclease V)
MFSSYVSLYREQLRLKKQMQTSDCTVVRHIMKKLDKDDFGSGRPYYIGGVDISFVKGNNVDACAAFIVISFPDLKVCFQSSTIEV